MTPVGDLVPDRGRACGKIVSAKDPAACGRLLQQIHRAADKLKQDWLIPPAARRPAARLSDQAVTASLLVRMRIAASSSKA